LIVIVSFKFNTDDTKDYGDTHVCKPNNLFSKKCYMLNKT